MGGRPDVANAKRLPESGRATRFFMLYILKHNRPIQEPDPIKWAEWYWGKSHRVALTKVRNGRVSTIFTGVSSRKPPELFETMVFRRGKQNYQIRFKTWDEAIIGHKAVVALCGGEIARRGAKKT